MKRRIRKKVISLTTAVIILLQCLSLSAFAYNDGELYTFVFYDGTEVNYYLDSDGMPYCYENGEKIYMALPLEHLRITDEAILAELEEARLEIENNTTRAIPTNYVDLSQCAYQQNSPYYTRAITFATTSTEISTPVFKLYEGHHSIRLKMYNIEKAHWYSSTNITYRYAFYDPYSNTWSSVTIKDADCTLENGSGYKHTPSAYPYGRYYIVRNNNLVNFDIRIWTTTAY